MADEVMITGGVGMRYSVAKDVQEDGTDWQNIEEFTELLDDECALDMADWPYKVWDSEKSENDNIICWCSTKQEADGVAAALNATPIKYEDGVATVKGL